MKKICTVLIVFLSFTTCLAQNKDIREMVDSLQYLKADTLDCSADLYWRIIAQGEKAIPFLINKLTDTTQTNARFHCKKTTLNVGEVAYFALQEIGNFPAFVITKIQFDDYSMDGCWDFYDFLFINENKARYKKDVSNWYAANKTKFKAEKYPGNN